MNLIRTALLALIGLTAPGVFAGEPAAYKEGVDYVPVGHPASPSADPARLTVEEFFWYGCPHCYAAEPELERWLSRKPADVDFVRVPNTLGREIGLVHSKAFYAAGFLGIQDKVHRALFDAIHTEHLALATPAEVAAFLVARGGVQRAAADGAMESFIVNANVERAEEEAQRYGVTGTPSIVVDGRYRVNIATPEAMFKVTDYLLDLVRKQKAEGPQAAPVAEAAPAATESAATSKTPEATAPQTEIHDNRLLIALGALAAAGLLVAVAVLSRRRAR